MDEYRDTIARLLELRPLADEAAGADVALRCTFTPSFHPECAVTLIERAGTAELTIRAPARSIWTFLNARQGSFGAAPVTDWVEPAISVERLSWSRGPRLLASGEAAARSRAPIGPASGIDGMGIDLELWLPSTSRSASLWSGTFDRGHPLHALVLALLELALSHATWELSRATLMRIRDDLPR